MNEQKPVLWCVGADLSDAASEYYTVITKRRKMLTFTTPLYTRPEKHISDDEIINLAGKVDSMKDDDLISFSRKLLKKARE